MKRLSSEQKRDLVLRMIRGEATNSLAQEIGVRAQVLQAWYDLFLAHGLQGLDQKQPQPTTVQKTVRKTRTLRRVRKIVPVVATPRRTRGYVAKKAVRKSLRKTVKKAARKTVRRRRK